MSYEDKILEMKNPGFQSVFFWFPYEKRSQNIPIWGKPVVFKYGNIDSFADERPCIYKVTCHG